jgi:serine/threonine protein kinase
MSHRQLSLFRHSPDWLVWRGAHPASGHRVTVKQVNPTTPYPERMAARLTQEYEFYSALKHTHLLQVCQFDPAGRRILFDDTQGPLAQLLRQEGRLTGDLVANVMHQCLQALDYLHTRRLGHGSLGAQTVLVAPNGSIRLGDFVGYRLDQGEAPLPPDFPLKYQAPELMDTNLGQPSPLSDLYCLGYLALELLTGPDFERLFDADEAARKDPQANWLGWHANPALELVGWQQALPHAQEGMLRILAALIHKDPKQRVYRSARDVINDLRHAGLTSTGSLPPLGGLPAESPPRPPGAGEARPSDAARPRPAATTAEPTRARASGAGLPLVLRRATDGAALTFGPDRPVVVGRDRDCDLVVRSSVASSRHTLLDCHADGHWYAYDLRSAAGTRLDNALIRGRARLAAGMEIRFADEAWVVGLRAAPVVRKVGRFVIEAKICDGRHGKLYRARDSGRDNRVVALRVYPPDFQYDEEMIRRFLRGNLEAAEFRHQNIVRLYWGGYVRARSGKLWYLAMEHMAGGSLRDRIRQQGRLGASEVTRYAGDIASALEEAAECQVLHRNINPACILFDSTGQAKLGDFTLLRGEVLDSMQEITRAGSLPGEHVYQAPEVVRGDRDVGPAADLYSLAATMYEALSGRPPYDAKDTLPDLVKDIIRTPPAPLRDIEPSIPVPLERLVLRALAKQPVERYPDAAAFRRALDELPVG